MHCAQQSPGLSVADTAVQSEPVATPAPAPLLPTIVHVPAPCQSAKLLAGMRMCLHDNVEGRTRVSQV